MKTTSEKSFLLGIIFPLGGFVLGLKMLRIFETVVLDHWWQFLELVQSDIFILIGFSAFGILLLRKSAQFHADSKMLWALQIIALFWAVMESIAHRFYMVTGSFFDVYLMAFAVSKLNEISSVISSEAPLKYTLSLLLSVSVLIALPRLLLVHLTDKKGIKTVGQKKKSFWSYAFIACICIIATALSTAIPSFGKNFIELSRSNLLNMVLTLEDSRGFENNVKNRMALDKLHLEPKAINSRDKNNQRKNLAIIILESTRARSTTVYNKSLDTTPFLASLAEKSLVAQRAYAIVPHTSKALVSILCGIEPHLQMQISESEPGQIPTQCLPELLGHVGYQSVFFQSATQTFEDRAGLVSNMGFERFIPLEKMNAEGLEDANYFGPEDAVMLAPSEKWLRENANDKPFVATYMTLAPHHNYQAPMKRYGRKKYAKNKQLNRYLNAVHYVDQFSRELVEQYKRLGLYENTLFVILGDHGEAFGEHRRYQHDNIIWQEGLHIPLLVFDPTHPVGSRIEHPVSEIDLLPTLVDMLGYEIKGGSLPGNLFDKKDPNRKLFALCWYEHQCAALITGGHEVIDYFGKKEMEYYDLVLDPYERNNNASILTDQQKKKYRSEIYSWRSTVNKFYDNSIKNAN